MGFHVVNKIRTIITRAQQRFHGFHQYILNMYNFINQLVSEEESDHEYPELANKLPCSHFKHYLDAMAEIGADTTVISMFIDTVRQDGIDIALELPEIHSATKEFVTFTFDVIKQNQPHLTVAALALGREDLVPQLFRSLENNLQITRHEAPKFFHYLGRHIQFRRTTTWPNCTIAS